MDCEWREGSSGTFHNGFIALDEIQYINAAICVVRHFFRKPVSSSFNEFPLMQAGSFLKPTIAFTDFLDLIDQVLFHPIGRAIPLNVFCAVIDVNGSWASIKTQAAPI